MDGWQPDCIVVDVGTGEDITPRPPEHYQEAVVAGTVAAHMYVAMGYLPTGEKPKQEHGEES